MLRFNCFPRGWIASLWIPPKVASTPPQWKGILKRVVKLVFPSFSHVWGHFSVRHRHPVGCLPATLTACLCTWISESHFWDGWINHVLRLSSWFNYTDGQRCQQPEMCTSALWLMASAVTAGKLQDTSINTGGLEGCRGTEDEERNWRIHQTNERLHQIFAHQKTNVQNIKSSVTMNNRIRLFFFPAHFFVCF